ncbi:polyribonucleotide nucleotidyltransferase [Natranaerovirga hydrolytica]|uniref:Polyribonucleotide nucleotidyltransferase n=1 Tax=Natranaerovirga hydrolytica TaxID=680378 RepID=A0A4R1MXV1_9FIRM|nr:polyribonucleotide nucleotidyltransferase [Natranaerovirga hydrolytica]TCK97945.1 polyribonucleotide nucleotidyltransferase [Natranaerovirga hydrolytica]
MIKTYSMELAGRTLSVEIGKVAEQANGAALIRYGETVVLSTVTASEKPRDGINFFPLSVDYEEKFYSVGKIPGGFIKREGRPSENSVLTSRVIDRPLRPLFPSDYRNDVSIVNTVLSVDQDASPEITAMIGSALVLSISDIPFNGPVGATVVGCIDGEYIINPTSEQREKSTMAVTVVSTSEKVMMLEATANEVPEQEVIQAIFKGDDNNKKIVEFIEGIVKEVGKEKHEYERTLLPEEIFDKVKAIVSAEEMENAVFTDEKQVRAERISEVKEKIAKVFQEENEELLSYIDEAVYKYEKETVRKMILKDNKRPDGRSLEEIRALESEVDILPRTHGSSLFKRGQTQALTVATLGALGDVQLIDGLDELEDSKRYMHHYNFPAYSVGEARPSRGPGRREIGHGALAEKALLPVIPSEEEFPYAIRLVSEILSSNGSTSQASICASTLALMSAGVPIKAPVAGISVGLVTGDTDDDYVLLTDIQGLEDFFGDMDFKVAGSHKGITAIQLDMKILGLTRDIIEKSIYQTERARKYILDEVMLKAISEPRKALSPYAPKILQTKVNPEKISEIIGPRGKTINKIIEETNVKIDIEDDGRVFICGVDDAMTKKALEIIESITKDIEVGKTYNGKVTKLMKFGAFVEIAPGKEGLVHISKLAKERVENVEDVVAVGDAIVVKVTEIDNQGRINLRKEEIED